MNHNEKINYYRQKQKEEMNNPQLSHDIGLYHYWIAKEFEQKNNTNMAEKSWYIVLLNWAAVIENQNFWDSWSKSQKNRYQSDISNDQINSAKTLISRKICQDLSLFANHNNSKANSSVNHLQLYFDLEKKSIQLLNKLGGFHINSGENNVVCGPMMLRELELAKQFSLYIVSLSAKFEQKTDKKSFIEELLSGDDSDDKLLIKQMLEMLSSDEKSEEKQSLDILMRYYSKLGLSTILMDKFQTQQALDLLERPAGILMNGLCNQSSDKKDVFPKCTKKCSFFDQCNPAYAELENGEQLLYHHSIKFGIDIYMKNAELAISSKEIVIESALRHWNKATELGRIIDQQSQIKNLIVDMIIGRSITLKKNRSFDQAIYLLSETSKAYNDKKLKGKLAEIYTDRGVSAGNNSKWEEAINDLDQAYELNPLVPRISKNYIIALRSYAHELMTEKNAEKAKEMLKKGMSIIEKEIESDPENSELQSELSNIQMQLALVDEDGDGGILGSLKLLSDLLEDDDDDNDEDEDDQEGKINSIRLLKKLSEAISEDGDEDKDDNFHSLMNKSTLLIMGEQYDQAEKVLLKAIEIDSSKKQPFIALSKVYAFTENWETFINAQKRIAEIDPDEKSNVYNNIGGVYQKEEQYDKAIECFQKAIEFTDRSNDKSDIYENLADTYVAQGQFEHANQLMDKSLKLNPKNKSAKSKLETIQVMKLMNGSDSDSKSTGNLLEKMITDGIAELFEKNSKKESYNSDNDDASKLLKRLLLNDSNENKEKKKRMTFGERFKKIFRRK